MTTAAQPFNNPVDSMVNQAIAFCHAGNLGEGIRIFRELTELQPENANNWSNLGSALCNDQKVEEGIECFDRAVELNPNDSNARTNLVNGLSMKLMEALAGRDHGQKLHYSRRILGIDPNNHVARLNLFEALADSSEASVLSDFSNTLKPEDIGTKILMACMPKSGSSWLFNALINLTGFAEDRYANGFMQNEQEIHLPRVIQSVSENAIIQQHCRATNPNVSILQGFGIRPLVLVRNLFDALVSMHDFYDSGAIRNTFHNADWKSMDAQTKLDLVAESVAPWYLQFFASWVQADQAGKLPVMWLTYEDMIADKPGTLSRVARHYGLVAPKIKIDATIQAVDGDKHNTRFNKGVAGRGAEIFSAEQQDRVRSLTRFYPSVDFSPIGL